MKITKYLFAFAAVTMGLLTSCDTDNEGAIYTPENVNVSFAQEEPDQILTQDASYTIPVRLVRSDASSEYTARYTFTSADEGIFTDPNGGTVTFAAGEGSKTINIEAANMEKGTEYSATLTLSDADVAVADTTRNNMVASTTISIMCDYNWESAGSGTFTDGIFEQGTTTVQVRHAEGTDIYRIYQPYLQFPASIGFQTDDTASLDFHMDASGNVTMDSGFYGNVEGYTLYYDDVNFPDYCSFTNTNGTLNWSILLVQNNQLITYCPLQFEWTDGYPIQ